MARKPLSIEGVMRNINKELEAVRGRTVAGLLQGGLLVQRRSQKKVPVEQGNLRATAYTMKALDDPNTVEVGYGAVYALAIHENMEQKLKGQPRPSGLGDYWGPNGEPKFLESALNESADDIVRIAAKRARVK